MKLVSTQIFSILLLLLFGLSSCDKNSEPKAPTKPSQQQEQFLSLKLKRANAVTLRSNSVSNDPMLQIKNLRLIFYRGSEGSEVATQVIDKIFTESMKDGFDIKLPPSNYKLIVLANPSSWLKKLTTVGSPISKLTQAQEVRASEIYNFQNESQKLSIPMANEQGIIAVSQDQFHPSNTLSSGLNPIEFKLETMLARVLVFGTPQIKGTKPAGQEAYYLVNNLARSVTPLRHLAKLSNNTLEKQGDGSSREERYAFSTLWTQWENATPTNTDLIASYSEKGYQNSGNWLEVKETREAYNDVLDKNVIPYAKETTLPPTAYLQGLTPCVVIKYPYVPEGLTLNENEGWLSYQGLYYSESEAKTLLSESNLSQDPLKTALVQEQVTEEAFKKGFKKGGISFYHQAYNYYTVYIRHFEDAKAKDAYGRYGIVRGNEYRIEIQSIEQAGLPTPPLFRGNTEAIAELENSAIKFFVSEVTARNQEVEL